MSDISLPLSIPTITFLISNMHCTSCCETIHHLLSTLPSIKSISTSLLHHSVTFSIDQGNTASTSLKPKTVGKVVSDALGLLRTEGGFNVIAESANGRSLKSDSATTKLSEEDGGWIGRLLLKNTKGRERTKAEERKKKHLEHCEVCKAELSTVKEHGSASGAAEIAPAEKVSSDNQGETVKTTLSIEGMTCASCVNSITSSLKTSPSILSADINLLGSSGIVRHRSSLSPNEVVSLIEDIGFDAQIVKSETEISANSPIEDTTTIKSTFSIEGMTCASCSGAIIRSLQDQPGVKSVHVDLLNNSGAIIHSDEVTTDEIKELVEEVGYGAELLSSERSNQQSKGKAKEEGPHLRSIQIKVEGMFCHDCVRKINSHLDTLPIESYTPITLQSPIITLSYFPYHPLTIRNLLQGISDVAPEFEAELFRTQSLSERSKSIQKREVKILASHLVVAITFAIPTFVIAIVAMILLPSHNQIRMEMMNPIWGAANLGTLILWPLATIVQFGVGRIFYKRTVASMWPHVRRLLPLKLRTESMRKLPSRSLSWRILFSFGSMDLLVALSTTVSYFASLAMLILDVRSSSNNESVGTYFDSCVFLIMFILLGRTLEAYAKSRTTDAISLLGKMRPDTALLVESSLSTGDEQQDDGERKNSQDTEDVQAVSVTDVDVPNHNRISQGSVRKIPITHLEIGDLILLQPGSLPPTDGTIVSGQTTFDESSLTGESLPITKTIDDPIFTGTVNLTSAVNVKVTHLAEDTMLEKIIRAVSDASSRKAPLELMAEKLTGVFVPIIVYLSLIVLTIWLSLSLTGTVDTSGKSGGKVFFALEFAIATLVVACPCGIGLAVPCANAVGNGIAAKEGILASGGGEAFLAATKIGKIVFDKTGTLTIGRSVVTDEEWITQENKFMIMQAVEEVERGSTHPLAIGLVEYLENKEQSSSSGSDQEHEPIPDELKRKAKVIESEEIAGRGLKAIIQCEDRIFNLLIGNVAHQIDHKVAIQGSHQDIIDKWSNEAKSVILIAISSANETSSYTLSAIYSLSDPPRETSASVITSLKQRGIEISMLSGDNQSTALAVGKMVGLSEDEVKGGVGPEGKADVIRSMQKEMKAKGGKKDLVMFVGDGLNDSVALAAADVSCAMGHGSQATLASADFVLLSSSLTSLLPLLSISRKVIMRQKLNLLWALLFNVVCLPFAAGVFYAAGGIRLTPVWSAVLMALSSISVVGSSLAMRWGF
ncbi:uncharacterized protein IL334_004877 [Kwoniella shivajii]|uniref:HMA domain-containing protein n=1 Tax=Kwoniella shivajii TaxID=564305 RepID=A0ABZ1D257_9TREE|nr:hypothetical protein IL334_004877 [Kwoniella shivajii]